MTAYLLSLFALLVLPLFPALFLKQVPISSRWYAGLVFTGLFFIAGHALRLPEWSLYFYFSVFCLFLLFKHAPRQSISSWTAGTLHDTRVLLALGLLLLIIPAHIHIMSRPVGPLTWDALSIWFRKVKLLYHWAPLENSVLADWSSRINYPHLGPMLQMLTLKFTGVFIEGYGRLLFPVLYLFWILSLPSLHPGRPTLLHTALFLFIGVLFFDIARFTSGYQEAFIVTLGGMAAIHACRALSRPAPLCQNKTFRSCFEPDFFLAFLFAGALCFVKTEGSVLGAILAGTTALTYLLCYRETPLRQKLYFLLPYCFLFALLFILWPVFLIINGNPLERFQGEAFSSAQILGLHQNLDRWPFIQAYFAGYFKEHLHIIAACALLSPLAAVIFPEKRRPLAFLWLAYFLHLIFIALPYLATAENLHWHLRESFDRLAYQHIFIYATILGLGLSALADKILSAKTLKTRTAVS